jgi:hypothetical protein
MTNGCHAKKVKPLPAVKGIRHSLATPCDWKLGSNEAGFQMLVTPENHPLNPLFTVEIHKYR